MEGQLKGDTPFNPQVNDVDFTTSSMSVPSKDMNQGVGKNDSLNFLKWCIKKGTSIETCETYTRYLQKPLNKNNRWSVKAYNLYYRYKGVKEVIKVPKTSADLYVPTVEEVKQTLQKVEGSKLYLLYLLLLESGIREVEALKVLSEYDETKDHFEQVYYYEIGYVRGSKTSIYAFHFSKLEKLHITKNEIDYHLKGKDVVRPKYIRKFVATSMISLGIPSEVVDFYQGRVPRSVLSTNYLNLFVLAKKYYPLYAEWLKQTLA
ncbi:integrase [Metallosphaera sedula]|uniref:integrase n=1 Tax=Metallosphaera sedula TaxID=43687 RepID=UPI0020BFAC26|nr:integrase [Metallosphaera sedula]